MSEINNRDKGFKIAKKYLKTLKQSTYLYVFLLFPKL